MSFSPGEDLVKGGKAKGEELRKAYTDKQYHQPADEWSESLDFTGEAQDVTLLYNVGRSDTHREAALVAESPTVGVTPDYDVPGGVTDARDTADDGGRSAAPRSEPRPAR